MNVMLNSAKRLSTLLTSFRNETGLSLREFSTISNISHSNIHNLESVFNPQRGAVSIPTIETLRKLSVAMNMNLHEIVDYCGYCVENYDNKPLYIRTLSINVEIGSLIVRISNAKNIMINGAYISNNKREHLIEELRNILKSS